MWLMSREYKPFEFPLDMSKTIASPTPNLTSTDTRAGWQVYRNQEVGFEFQYPKEALKRSGENPSRIDLPFEQGTLLSEKYAEIFAVPSGGKECLHRSVESVIGESEHRVEDVVFKKQVGNGAAAGNIYERESYSARIDDFCVTLEFVLRSANPGVYISPPPDFNRQEESAIFGEILSTFRATE